MDTALLKNRETRLAVSAERATSVSLISLHYVSLLACLGFSIVLVISYFVFIKPLVTLPADILMWEETNFVGDMIKLRIGAPIYTAPSDNNSLVYTPLAPLLTYALSWLIRRPESIIGWRLIQLGFVTCAAALATRCSRRLLQMAAPERRIDFPRIWLAITFLVLFLAATAPEVNRFVYLLHIDALALLISVFSFWTMLRYLNSPSWRGIVLMAICPALGYLTKQFLISWAVVMFVFLLLHNYRDIKRLALYSALAAMFIALAVGGCYLLWGDPYIFWTFTVMGARKGLTISPGSRQISIVRMLDHSMRAWPELIIGIIGGILVLRYRSQNIRKFGPLWLAWLTLVLSEAFSSGAGWDTVYHFGPGVLIGATWFLAALPLYWPSKPDVAERIEFPRIVYAARILVAVAAVFTLMLALRVVPNGDRKSSRYWAKMKQSSDVNRYVADIESEFTGLPADKVLLDIGNWIYLRKSVLQKDRAISLADQPAGGRYENMDVFVSHIRQRSYDKILVHDLHSPFFIYDWYRWPRSSGVRQALLDNYQEVRTISPVDGKELLPETAYTGPISVLVPR